MRISSDTRSSWKQPSRAASRIAPFLRLLSEPRRLYESLVEKDRRTLRAICFERLSVDSDADQLPTVTRNTMTDSIAPLVRFRDRKRRNGTCPEADAVLPMGQGSSKNPLAGHKRTSTTREVYRKQLRPVITKGAELLDTAFENGQIKVN